MFTLNGRQTIVKVNLHVYIEWTTHHYRAGLIVWNVRIKNRMQIVAKTLRNDRFQPIIALVFNQILKI